MDDDQKHQKVKTPQNQGEESISGSMAGVESDDNTLDAAHEMGLYQKADEEHPKEVGIAEEIDKAEKNTQRRWLNLVR